MICEPNVLADKVIDGATYVFLRQPTGTILLQGKSAVVQQSLQLIDGEYTTTLQNLVDFAAGYVVFLLPVKPALLQAASLPPGGNMFFIFGVQLVWRRKGVFL